MHFQVTNIVGPILDSHTKQNQGKSISESNCQRRVLTKTYGLERKYRSNSICIYKDQEKLEQVQTSMAEVAYSLNDLLNQNSQIQIKLIIIYIINNETWNLNSKSEF